MTIDKKKCSCLHSSGNKFAGTYDDTYDSDHDNSFFNITSFKDLTSRSTDNFVRDLLFRSLPDRLCHDFKVGISPDDLYEAKQIGISIVPILSQKYRASFSKSPRADSKKKRKKGKDSKASKKHKKRKGK